MKQIRDVFIVESLRTPIGKRGGALAEIHPVDLFGNLLRKAVSRSRIPPESVDDVIAGCVNQVGEQAINIARNAWLSAGFPESVPGVTVDRQCGSSLQALTFAYQGIASGMADVIVAGGVESMTRVPMGSTINSHSNPITLSLSVRYGLDKEWFSQAKGAEMIAEKYGISRDEMDEYSYMSHVRASAARTVLKNEIEPVEVDLYGDKSEFVTVLEQDEGVRDRPDLEKMKSLPAAFRGLKRITAGNSSQISDGASATILCSEEAVEKYDLKPKARILGAAVVGVDPVTMLLGPIPATEKVLKSADLELTDIDLFEVNEAFAPVPLAWQRIYDVSLDRLNVHGGAIAIGHPLGATGTRLVATLINALSAHSKKKGLIAVCEGGGMANSLVIERM
ncbi:MAG TPA: thiolase family protein [Thermoplasmataceae archaeon]|nr:thiolase family protein [Thermoplasmatales archaeon AK]HLH86247.1 thiolase family protein [Thermoplasmataceae archaeon]